MEVFEFKGTVSRKEMKQHKYYINGKFVLLDDGIIKGTMNETCGEKKLKKYIYGNYREKYGILKFFAMSNGDQDFPYMYVFDTLEKTGVWAIYAPLTDVFFSFGCKDGQFSIQLNKINGDVKYNCERTLQEFQEVLDARQKWNMKIMEKGIDAYIKK